MNIERIDKEVIAEQLDKRIYLKNLAETVRISKSNADNIRGIALNMDRIPEEKIREVLLMSSDIISMLADSIDMAKQALEELV